MAEPKLKTYKVALQCIALVHQALVTVEAPDQETAESLAIELAEADDVDWVEDHMQGDIEVLGIEEVE